MTKTEPVKSPSAGWTFLTNHSHVLVCLVKNPDMTLRQVAQIVGITERAVQRLVADLEKGGVLVRNKVGRKNTYEIKLNVPLRHQLESHTTLQELLDFVIAGR